MPKLLQINPVVKNGSTGRIVEQIGVTAQKRGWKSYVAYSGRPKNTSSSKLIQVGHQLDAILHALETRIFDRHGLASRGVTREFVKQLEEIKPDVIHFHNIHGYYLNYPILIDYIYRKDIPVVWTFHDFWAMTGHCSYFSDVACEKWKTECFSCPKKKLYPQSILFDNSRNNYRLKKDLFSSISNLTIVPVSNWAASLVNESFFKNTPIHTIYNGVDTDIFYPKTNTASLRESLGLKDTFVLIGLATTWGKRKGWFDYIKLAKMLPPDIKILLVGVTEEQKKELPEEIITLSRTENVEQLADLYSYADIVMNLSYQETFGLTTVEGFACGTPSIVYNCTASPELMTEGVGEIVEPGDLAGVLQAILKIRENKKEFYSKKCREWALRKFSMKDRFNDYVDLYERLLIQPTRG